MADNTYNIFSSNGKEYIIDENTTNRETSLTFIGHGMPDYGEDQNTNFLHLLENFSSDKEPENPISGQLWYKLDDLGNELFIYENKEKGWIKIPCIVSNDSDELHKTGDIKYDDVNHELYVYDETLESKWNKIGPDNRKEIIKSLIPTITKEDYKFRVVLSKRDYFYNDIAVSGNEGSTGNLNMIKMTALAKEYSSSTTTPRSCGWIYTFLVRSVKQISGAYNVSIIGEPNYELIGKTDNTYWNIEISEDESNIYVDLLNYDKLNSNDELDFSCYFDVIRI